MTDRPFNVLFLCTGNSARSIMAEAILNRTGQGKFRAFSAGSYPKGQVNPSTIQLLKSLNYDTSVFRSKSWAEFAKPVPRHSISCLRSATTPLGRPVRCGLANR